MYPHRSLYRCSVVPRDFPALQEILLSENMVEDHGTRKYYECLQECQAADPDGGTDWEVRSRVCVLYPYVSHLLTLPHAQPFDARDSCAVCMCKFSWASTSGSEAQEVRDKLYCWGCGRLVCGPCSEGRRVLAEWGGRVS